MALCLTTQDCCLLNWNRKLKNNQMLNAYETKGAFKKNCGKIYYSKIFPFKRY